MTDALTNEFGQTIGMPVPGWRPPPVPPSEPMIGRFCRLERLDVTRHATQLFEANATDRDARNWTYFIYGPFLTLASYSEWLSQMAQKSDPFFYAIIDSRTNRATGVAAYLRIDVNVGVIEVGHLNFSPLLQRSPVATEAMYLMMKRAFDLGYRRYEWKCDSLNAPSRAAAQRLGFSYEGIFRQAIVYKGRNRDTAWFAVIDSEWPALRAAFETWLDPSNFDAQSKQRVSLRELTAPVLARRGSE